jgi:hypothetical protein
MRRHDHASCVAAFLFAALAPAAVYGALNWSAGFASLAFFISLAHALILGLPLFLLFQTHRWITIFSCVIGGFIVGIFPIGFFTWPFWPGSGSSSSFNGVPLIVNGTPTFAGWISYAETLLILGSFGALAGFVFWLVFKLSGGLATATEPISQAPPRKNYRAIAFAVVAVLLAGSTAALPLVMMDRTCHNMGRGGGGTFSVKARVHLPVDHDDWPKLRNVVKDFSTKHKLSFKDFNEGRPDLERFLDVSLCDDRGTNIWVNERQWSFREAALPPSRGIGIFVYEVRANSGWQGLVRDLVNELESSWPGKVRSAP